MAQLKALNEFKKEVQSSTTAAHRGGAQRSSSAEVRQQPTVVKRLVGEQAANGQKEMQKHINSLEENLANTPEELVEVREFFEAQIKEKKDKLYMAKAPLPKLQSAQAAVTVAQKAVDQAAAKVKYIF
jgi:hypothetical protein